MARTIATTIMWGHYVPIYVHHRVGVHVYANTHVVWDALYRLLWEHQFSQP